MGRDTGWGLGEACMHDRYPFDFLIFARNIFLLSAGWIFQCDEPFLNQPKKKSLSLLYLLPPFGVSGNQHSFLKSTFLSHTHASKQKKEEKKPPSDLSRTAFLRKYASFLKVAPACCLFKRQFVQCYPTLKKKKKKKKRNARPPCGVWYVEVEER